MNIELNKTPPNKRGFAAMSREKVQAIAQKGGEKRAQQLGSAGYSELGRKGGLQSQAERKNHLEDAV